MSFTSHSPITTLSESMEVVKLLQQRLRAAIVGRDDVIDLVICALLADGHVLLEDYPGSGKTTLAKALGESLIENDSTDQIVPMRRVQFTPDLLPSDVTGTTIFDPDSKSFHFRPGPVFSHVLLADEINRTSPKVQSALLEAMAEKQCTVDNKTYSLDSLFFVIATQNPLDLAGTFPLPNAQLDRFLFKIRMVHIDRRDELNLLLNIDEIRKGASEAFAKVTPSQIVQAREVIQQQIKIADDVKRCLVNIAEETRKSNLSLQGVSTRSLVLALPALQVRAFLQQRKYVSAEDVEFLAPFIFAHRLMMAPGSGAPEDVISACMKEPIETLSRMVLR